MVSDSSASSPATWKVTDVLSWASATGLSADIASALAQNEVDGPTLVTLTKSELQSELGIASLPARRYLWELIQGLKSQHETSDFSTAIEVHEEEIEYLSFAKAAPVTDGPDSASGGDEKFMDTTSMSVIVDELQRDAQLQRQVIGDRMIAFRVQKMINTGQEICKDAELAHKEQERLDQLLELAESDRAYAESLASGRERGAIERRRRSEAQQREQEIQSSNRDRMSSLFGLSVQACSDHKVNVAEAFRTGKVKPMTKVAALVDDDSSEASDCDRKPAPLPRALFDLPFIEECIACYETNTKGYHLACGHTQCIPCMRKLFRVGLGDTKLLPLKCCEIPIDMNIANDLLEPENAALILQRVEEKQATNKMYCPSCSSFLNLDMIDNSDGLDFRCDCGTILCTACKTESHPGLTCRENRSVKSGSDELVLDLSRKEGWKQCPKCSILIELRSGCNHMTCSSCDYEFCYRCLQAWNTRQAQCSSGTCELWDEDRLIERANARVQQVEAARGERLPEPIRREHFARAMDGLRNNEVCRHDWVRRGGYKGACPNCGFEMFAYGMYCRSDCGSTVCYTCAHHRLPRRGWR